jgi:hypothetical protein
MHRPRPHFIILVVGSIMFLLGFFWAIEPSGSTEAGTAGLALLAVDAVTRGLTILAWYAVFSVLVLSHGLLVKRGQEKGDAESGVAPEPPPASAVLKSSETKNLKP